MFLFFVLFAIFNVCLLKKKLDNPNNSKLNSKVYFFHFLFEGSPSNKVSTERGKFIIADIVHSTVIEQFRLTRNASLN